MYTSIHQVLYTGIHVGYIVTSSNYSHTHKRTDGLSCHKRSNRKCLLITVTENPGHESSGFVYKTGSDSMTDSPF